MVDYDPDYWAFSNEHGQLEQCDMPTFKRDLAAAVALRDEQPTIHLSESLDNIGELDVWCGAINPQGSDDPDRVNCLACLRNFTGYARRVQVRYDALKESPCD